MGLSWQQIPLSPRAIGKFLGPNRCHSPMHTAADLMVEVILEAARESLSLTPSHILGQSEWTAADPQLKEI